MVNPDISRIACSDRGYERPSGRPRVSDPATYCSSTPRIQPPAVSRWHTLLHGLPTAIREISGLYVLFQILHRGGYVMRRLTLMLFQLFLSIFAVYAVLYDVPQKKALRGCWQIRKVHLQSLP
jgi:hypothetical protein